jgi:hypothetical protein
VMVQYPQHQPGRGLRQGHPGGSRVQT